MRYRKEYLEIKNHNPVINYDFTGLYPELHRPYRFENDPVFIEGLTREEIRNYFIYGDTLFNNSQDVVEEESLSDTDYNIRKMNKDTYAAIPNRNNNIYNRENGIGSDYRNSLTGSQYKIYIENENTSSGYEIRKKNLSWIW